MTENLNMMKPLIEAIHSSPTQAVIYVAGAAAYAVGWLTSVPGASNTVLEAAVPYSKMSMIQLLGKIPARFASQQTSEEMALVAYNRALKISKRGRPVLGVGVTGGLATNRSKLGDHRFHLSTRTSNQLWNSTVTLAKGIRTREEEEILSSRYVLEAIASASKVPVDCASLSNESDVSITTERLYSEDEELEQLLNGNICFKVYDFSRGTWASTSERKIVLPGSFNPLHEGHLHLMEVAISLLGDGYPCFELSAFNADKPPLTVSQIKDRVKQFEKVGVESPWHLQYPANRTCKSSRRMTGQTVLVSTQPFYYKKAELFPGSAFVIGADTAVRLINPKYYDGNYERMIEALLKCKNTGCVFIVGGRNVEGVFKDRKTRLSPLPRVTFLML